MCTTSRACRLTICATLRCAGMLKLDGVGGSSAAEDEESGAWLRRGILPPKSVLQQRPPERPQVPSVQASHETGCALSRSFLEAGVGEEVAFNILHAQA